MVIKFGGRLVKAMWLIFLILLYGCAVYDKTNDPIDGAIVGVTYKTVKDSFLYMALCADIDAKIGFTESCLGIQAFNSGNEYFRTPRDYNTYLESRAEWD
ncbi:MAG: hypothetical protein ACKO96_24020, partial [Flammeovirgaceae bacterium]